MATKPKASISKIAFSSGQIFAFQPNEKVIFVGPNNSGKSLSLREILSIAENGTPAVLTAVFGIEISKIGNSDDLRIFLENHGVLKGDYYQYKSWMVHRNFIRQWDQDFLRNGLSKGFIKNIDAENRLKITIQQQSIRPDEHKAKPQQVLYDDSALTSKISKLFHRAFGAHILIDFRGGSVIPIHVGSIPSKSLVDRVSDEYLAAVRENPLLDQQGDGMKSYAGILFETIVDDLDITLLDEPEAFLHPPQMRQLGQTLASEVNRSFSLQHIAATSCAVFWRALRETSESSESVVKGTKTP